MCIIIIVIIVIIIYLFSHLSHTLTIKHIKMPTVTVFPWNSNFSASFSTVP